MLRPWGLSCGELVWSNLPLPQWQERIDQHEQTYRNGNLHCMSDKTTKKKKTRLYLTEALIVTSPFEISMPAAEQLAAENCVAWSRAPSWAFMRKEFALQSSMWKLPPSMIQAATLITPPPWERKQVSAAQHLFTLQSLSHFTLTTWPLTSMLATAALAELLYTFIVPPVCSKWDTRNALAELDSCHIKPGSCCPCAFGRLSTKHAHAGHMAKKLRHVRLQSLSQRNLNQYWIYMKTFLCGDCGTCS